MFKELRGEQTERCNWKLRKLNQLVVLRSVLSKRPSTANPRLFELQVLERVTGIKFVGCIETLLTGTRRYTYVQYMRIKSVIVTKRPT